MRISIAPYLPIIVQREDDEMAFENLCLLGLPQYVTLYVAGDWDEILLESNVFLRSYETYRLLLKLPVIEMNVENKAVHIKIDPDIISELPQKNQDTVKQQLFALLFAEHSKKIFAGANMDSSKILLSSDHTFEEINNYNPYGKITLLDLIDTYLPRLEQLKHYHNNRKLGVKNVSAFSAYYKNDEEYAKSLLSLAFDEYPGDVNDRTYLYTYDKKYKTFVEFRPGRNNVYHGMDISLEEAKRKSPDIVKKYHK